MQQPSFSVIIPTYQRRDVVCDALRAVCAIRYVGPIEVVVVVDGSTDGTAEALGAISCPFPLKIITQSNAGAAAARNRGVAASGHEILLFMDDDMICKPDIVEQHALSLAAGADAVLGDIPIEAHTSANFLSRAVNDWTIERKDRLAGGGALTLFDLLTGQLSIRRNVFEEIGGFDRQFTHGGSFGNEDLDIGTRLLDHNKVVFNPLAISYQRYVVTPRQNMKQWLDAGQADVAFARKHPKRAAELFDLHGYSRARTRWFRIPLSRLPRLPALLAGMATWLVEQPWGQRLPLRKFTAQFFFFARDLLYWSGVHSKGGVPANHPVLVLCYHAIADLSQDRVLFPYGTPRDQFEAQLDDLLRRKSNFITAQEFLSFATGVAGVPERAALLTFDDCYAELADVAETVLVKRGIPALAFAVSGTASHSNEWDQTAGSMRLPLLDDAGLRRLESLGVEIGCHSQSHPEMPKLSSDRLETETSGAVSQLIEAGINPPRFFAYPYGESDAASRAAVAATGIAVAFGLAMRFARRSDDLMNVPRVEIHRRDRGWRFWLKTTLPGLAGLVQKPLDAWQQWSSP